MIIVIDIDDVLADSIPVFRKFLAETYDIKTTDAEVARLPYLGFMGGTKEEAAEKILAFNGSPYFFLNKPVPGAIEAISELSKDHTLKILTSRPLGIKEGTEDWLEKHFPSMFAEVHYNNANHTKEYVPGDGTHKGELLHSMGADIFIDDILDYVNGCPKDISAILLDRPWNQGVLESNVTRARNWREILEVINTKNPE